MKARISRLTLSLLVGASCPSATCGTPSENPQWNFPIREEGN